MTHLMDDFRFALRSMWKRPGFSALVILTLAICIGANTAIFSVVNTVLLRQLPFRQPAQLVAVSERLSNVMSGAIPVSAPDYQEFVRSNHSFDQMGIFHIRRFELSGLQQPERVDGLRMSASLFPMLGVEPALGRNFTAEEDRKGQKVTILSAALWRSKFGGDPGVLGKTLLLDRVPYVVVGVMPDAITFPLRGPRFNNVPAELFVPVSFTKEELQDIGNMFNYSVIARLKPGVRVAQASEDMQRMTKYLSNNMYPAYMRAEGLQLGTEVMPLRQYTVGQVQPILLVLLGAVGFVLLIGCADIASLLLTRGAARRREMSIRAALGASRFHLTTQVLVESLTLAVAGGLAAIVLASWITSLLSRTAAFDLPIGGVVHLDARVMLFCGLLSVFTAVLFGIFPAMQTGRLDVNEGLREGGRSQAGGRNQNRTLSAIVTVQFAFALVLLTGSGLLIRSFGKLLDTDPGFQPDHVLTMSLSVPASAYEKGSQVREFYRRVLEAVQGVPGVKAASVATSLPLNIDEHRSFSINGQMPSTLNIPRSVAQIWVKGDFFRTMGIPLKRGRYLDERDGQHADKVAVIGETLARTFWLNADPIGKQIKWGEPGSKGGWMRIVGVVGDVKPEGLEQATEPETYTPYEQATDNELAENLTGEMRSMKVVVRTSFDPLGETQVLSQRIHEIDPSVPISNVKSMDATLSESTVAQRFHTGLVAAFAGVALLLAGLGVGGVLAFTVAQRIPEIGVRLALGARRWDVLRLVFTRGMRLAAYGIGIGLLCSLWVVRLIGSVLYQTSPYDAVTFVVAPAVLCLAAFLAIAIPARRAASVDPLQALRSE